MEENLTFLNVFCAVVPIFGLIFLGAFFRYRGTLDADADKTIFWLVLHIFTPCLIFDSFLGNKALENAGNLISAPIIGYCTVLIGMAASSYVARCLGLVGVDEKRAFISCVSLYNYGYLPIPIILIFFPKEILGTLFVFNVGLELAMWTVVFMTIVGRTTLLETLKRVCTPPLLAIVLAVITNYFFVGNPLPVSVARLVHMTGQGTIPLALFVIGATIFDHAPIVSTQEGWRPVVWGTLLRLFFIPMTFIALALTFPLPEQLKTILFIQAAMPSAVLPIMFIRTYGGDLQLAIRIIVVTSLVSLITIPIYLSILF
jgi:malate permease and related proteins